MLFLGPFLFCYGYGFIHRLKKVHNPYKLVVFSLCRYYSVSLSIGHTAKVFDLDIDSGSDLTWVQCDAPCNGCTMVNLDNVMI